MIQYSDFPNEREIVLSNGNTKVGVIPELSLVSHFQVGEWPVLYRAAKTGNTRRWGLPLMIPNFSMLKDGVFVEKGTKLPMHGFGRNLPWQVIEQDNTSITLQLTSSEQTLEVYPYAFVFTAHIAVDEETLTYTLTIENKSDEVMPIAPGFHPYFTVAQQDKARLEVEGLPAFDIKAVKWDTQPPNEPYPFPHEVTVTFPDAGVLTIVEEPVDGKYSLADMQVWTEAAQAPDHDFVCFEPIVTYADGLNRPQDRLNIPPHSSQQIVLKLLARPS